MNASLLFVVLLIGFMIQGTVFQVQPFNAVQPTLTVILILLIAFFRGGSLSLVLGLLLGLVQDIVYGSFIGMHSFSLAVVGYFSGSTFRMFLHRSFLLFMMTLLGYSFVYEVLNYGIARLFGSMRIDFSLVVAHSMRTMIFNGILAFFLYPLAARYFPKDYLGEDEL